MIENEIRRLSLIIHLTMDFIQGVHAFAVNIRDEQGKVTDNLRIMDVGPKQGANGIGKALFPSFKLLFRRGTPYPYVSPHSPIDNF